MLSDSIDQLLSAGTITNVQPGGVARTLIDIGVQRASELMDALEFNLNQSRLSNAAGFFLDLIGASRGIPRGGATTASVSEAEQNIRFYTADGSAIATVLPTKSIPAGTTVQNSDGSVLFRTIADISINDVESEVFVAAVSTGIGSDQNVGKNILTSHSLGGDLLVTNRFPVLNASDVEDDDSYRFRLTRSIFAAASANRSAVRVAAFGAADVADVQIRPFSNGIGTFDVFLVPRGNRLSQATIRSVQNLVAATVALGSRGVVRAPVDLPVELTVELVFTRETGEGLKPGIRESVRQAILQYIGEIPVGGLFVLNELIQRIQEVSTRILDNKIICYCFRGEPQVLQNMQAFDDEMFVPRDDVSNPIQVL